MKKKNEMSFHPLDEKMKTIQDEIKTLSKKMKNLEDKKVKIQTARAKKILKTFGRKMVDVNCRAGKKKWMIRCRFLQIGVSLFGVALEPMDMYQVISKHSTTPVSIEPIPVIRIEKIKLV
ncbi:MAG: hypothetical protein PHG83_02650 [Patescibacteria group bacterium]|nr:hypothetical protein [Patescibacteria group bacterium]